MQGPLMERQRFGSTSRCQGQCCRVGGLLLQQLLVKNGVGLAEGQAGPGGAGRVRKAIQQQLPGLFGHRCLALGRGLKCCPFENDTSEWIASPALTVEEFIRSIPGHHQQGGFPSQLRIDGPAVVLPELRL